MSDGALTAVTGRPSQLPSELSEFGVKIGDDFVSSEPVQLSIQPSRGTVHGGRQLPAALLVVGLIQRGIVVAFIPHPQHP